MIGKLALGAVLTAVPTAFLISPAAADTAGSDTDLQEITFTYQGNEVTCELFGRSHFGWTEVTDETTGGAQTNWQGDAPCDEIVVSLGAEVAYRRDGQEETVGSSTLSGQESFVRFTESGAITDMTVTHGVSYRCDDEAQGDVCFASLTTNPK